MLDIDKHNITTQLSYNYENLNTIITSLNNKKKIIKYQWYYKFNPIGQIFEYEINPGDCIMILTNNTDIDNMETPILLPRK